MVADRRRASLLTVDLLFFAANLTKFIHGAWLPLLIGVTVVHRPDDVAAWPPDRHRPPRVRRGLAARLPRRPPQPSLSGPARPGHRRVPQPRKRDRSPGHARQRRARPRPQRARVIVVVDTLPCPASRRPSASSSTTSATPTTASPTSRRASATWRPPTSRALLALVEPAAVEFPLDLDGASYFVSTIELRSGTGTSCADGRSACSSRRRTSPPTPPTTSGCHATGP